MVIPRTLIVNAAKDAAELVSQLISKHTTAQTVKGKEEFRFLGLDLVKGEVVDNVKRGVLEPALSKVRPLLDVQFDRGDILASGHTFNPLSFPDPALETITLTEKTMHIQHRNVRAYTCNLRSKASVSPQRLPSPS